MNMFQAGKSVPQKEARSRRASAHSYALTIASINELLHPSVILDNIKRSIDFRCQN